LNTTSVARALASFSGPMAPHPAPSPGVTDVSGRAHRRGRGPVPQSVGRPYGSPGRPGANGWVARTHRRAHRPGHDRTPPHQPRSRPRHGRRRLPRAACRLAGYASERPAAGRSASPPRSSRDAGFGWAPRTPRPPASRDGLTAIGERAAVRPPVPRSRPLAGGQGAVRRSRTPRS